MHTLLAKQTWYTCRNFWFTSESSQNSKRKILVNSDRLSKQLPQNKHQKCSISTKTFNQLLPCKSWVKLWLEFHITLQSIEYSIKPSYYFCCVLFKKFKMYWFHFWCCSKCIIAKKAWVTHWQYHIPLCTLIPLSFQSDNH